MGKHQLQRGELSGAHPSDGAPTHLAARRPTPPLLHQMRGKVFYNRSCLITLMLTYFHLKIMECGSACMP
jgi:hypothetical protein